MSDFKLEDYEQSREVKTFKMTLKCPKCLSGEMRYNGKAVQLTSPPRHSHQCTHCADEDYFTKTYPYTYYE